MLRVLPRHGYAETTISHLTREAGLSRAAFYGQFANKEACFLATYDLAGQWLYERVERAAAGGEEWPDRVRAGLSEALSLLAANTQLARLIAVEAPQAGPAARERQQACIARLAEALRACRPRRPRLPVDLEELLVGGVFSLVARYVDTGQTERLPDATGELIQYLLIPYLEPEETKRIATRAA